MAERIPQTLSHSEEAERAVLACVLLRPELIRSIADLLGRNHFYFERHQEIWEAMRHIWVEHGDEAIDLRTLQARLDETKKFELIGGFAYLAGLDEGLPDLGGWEQYCRIVKECYVRRSATQRLSAVIADSMDSGIPLDTMLSELARIHQDLEAERTTGADYRPIGDLVDVVDLDSPPADLAGPTTGFPDLDRATMGCPPGELLLIAARTSMGKTAFMLSMILAQAKAGCRVGVASLEMSFQALALRVLAQRSQVPLWALRTRRLSDAWHLAASNAMTELARLGVWVDDTSIQTAEQICAKARRQASLHGLDALFVDYLGILRYAGGKSAAERATAIGDASMLLRALGKDLQIPVICLHQVSREATRREGKVPQLSDLRESGKLEENSDQVIFLHRPAYYDKELRNGKAEEAEAIIAKNREGAPATIGLIWKPTVLTYASAEEQWN